MNLQEANLLYLKHMILFCCLTIFATSSSYAKPRPAKAPMENDLIKYASSDSKIKPSAQDLKTANRISVFYDLVSKNNFNNYLLGKTKIDIYANRNYSSFRFWIDGLEKINDVVSFNSFFKYCGDGKNLEKTTRVNNILNEQLKASCLNKFLKLIQTSGGKIDLYKDKLAIKYMDDNLGEYLGSKFSPNFMNLIESISKKPKDFKIISAMIENFYITSEKNVPQNILDYVDISESLTKYIQQKGVNNYQTYRVFFDELSFMTKKLNALLAENNNNKDYVDSQVFEIINFFYKNREYFPQKRTLDRMLLNGKELMRNGYYKHAKQFYKLVVDNDLGDLREEAEFQNLWIDLSENDYPSAIKVIQESNLLKNFKELPAKMKFWIAYTFEQVNQKKLSYDLYNQLINEDPLTYYSTLAAQHIPSNTTSPGPDKVPSASADFLKILDPLPAVAFRQSNLSSSFVSAVKRLKAWANCGAKVFAENDGRDFLNLTAQEIFKNHNKSELFASQGLKEHLAIMVTNILNDQKDYLSTFNFLYSGLSKSYLTPSRQVLNALFPRPYLAKIKQYSSEIDSMVLLSLIRQESAFNPRAMSRVGATGLMQLMPATARSIRKDVSASQLEEPAVNLQIGIKYFNYLYSKFDQNLVYTLIAYNAGETKLRQWKSKVFNNPSMIHMIESIPYKETRNYVKHIYRNIYFYKLLDSNKVDSSSIDKIYDVSLAP